MECSLAMLREGSMGVNLVFIVAPDVRRKVEEKSKFGAK